MLIKAKTEEKLIESNIKEDYKKDAFFVIYLKICEKDFQNPKYIL